ncbi:MAG: hypothetical protein ACP5UO_01145 [Thermoplasmata archaeon]
MCDTLCKMGEGVTYFAKNSDREPSEAQYVEYHPGIEFRDKAKATYIQVDFNAPVNAVLISRPYWMWGAEMGVNERGVAIGNEAIFSKSRHKTRSLLGMDVLRLGLEKGTSARHATEVMKEYVETYGIGGSNSYRTDLYYENSFLIVDMKEAFILETEGKEHEVREVSGHGTISNFPSVRRYRLNNLYSSLGKGNVRQQTTFSQVKRARDVRDFIEIMRSHHDGFIHPRNGNNGDVCMHGGFLSRRDQTSNSLVVELRKDFIIVWTTYSGNPCVSLYRPIIFRNGLLLGPPLKEKGYWEKKELQHLDLFQGPTLAYDEYRARISKAQEEIFARFSPFMSVLESGGAPERNAFVEFHNYLESLDAELSGHLEGLRPSRSFYNIWVNRQRNLIANLHTN